MGGSKCHGRRHIDSVSRAAYLPSLRAATVRSPLDQEPVIAPADARSRSWRVGPLLPRSLDAERARPSSPVADDEVGVRAGDAVPPEGGEPAGSHGTGRIGATTLRADGDDRSAHGQTRRAREGSQSRNLARSIDLE
jgi:hypothetical protein